MPVAAPAKPKPTKALAKPRPAHTEAELIARARWLLLGSAAVTFGLYMIPYGQYIAYPLLLISTAVHELGHGVASMMMGAEFVDFRMWSDGSGVARHTGADNSIGSAFIAAGGLCGPAVAAAACFVAGRTPKWSQRVLIAFAVGLLLAMIMVVRGGFGLFFVGALAALLAAAAIWGRAELAQLVVVFLGVQLALSVYSRGDYLFMKEAHTSMGVMPSDSQQMALAMGAPYWFWGGLCAAFSGAVLLGGGWYFLRGRRQAAGLPTSSARRKSPA